MARHKNATINLPPANANNSRSWESINAALFMDLRDELQESNRMQREMLYVLKRMDKRMQMHMPLRARRAK